MHDPEIGIAPVYEVDDDEPQHREQFSDRIRIVHACWDQAQIDAIRNRLGDPARIDDTFLLEAAQPGTPAFEAIETLLKGPELLLPDGARFFDKDSNARKNIRYTWWAGGRSYRDVAIVPADQRSAVPDLPLGARYHEPDYSPEAPPVFFGHYWMNGDAQAQRHNVACLDYSAGKGGPLAAYRWLDGGRRLGAGRLRGDQFITTDDLQNPPLDDYTYPEAQRRAAWAAAKNGGQVRDSDQCGCFYCLSVFEPIELDPDDDWPLCPRCGVDYLIGSASGLPLTQRFLAEVKEFWLEPPFPDAPDEEFGRDCTMANTKSRRYAIETLQDFLQIPPDRLDGCLADFKDYLELIRPLSALVDMAKDVAEAEGDAIEEDATYGPFIWIDDGEPPSDGTATIQLQETDDAGLEFNIRKSSNSTLSD